MTVREMIPHGSTRWQWDHDADKGYTFRLSVGLVLKNIGSGVEALLSISNPRSVKYSQYWTATEVKRAFMPTVNTTDGVTAWFRSSGVGAGQIKISHDGSYFELDLSVAEADRLLNTKFSHFKHIATGGLHIACREFYIPDHVAKSVQYVVPLAIVKSRPLNPKRAEELAIRSELGTLDLNNCRQYTSPSCLRDYYGIPGRVVSHPNSSFGIFEIAWMTWLAEDLDLFFAQFSPDDVGRRPTMQPIDGGYTQTDYKNIPFNLEPNLDFEYAMALTAPQEVIDIQVGDKFRFGNINNMLAAFDRYYCDSLDQSIDSIFPDPIPGGYNRTTDCGTTLPPRVISISYGWNEEDFPLEYLERQCQEFLKLGLQGVTIIAGSGDYGTSRSADGRCHSEEGNIGNTTLPKFSSSWPSACPWVTSVGGTQRISQSNRTFSTESSSLHNESDPTADAETAFRTVLNGNRTLSSGGGFSDAFSIPRYQDDALARYKEIERPRLSQLGARYNPHGRGYPDVATQAYGYLVAINGKFQVVHGTSASAPVFASLVTILNSERMNVGKEPVGFINPTLYAYPGIFNDIQTGANADCNTDIAFQANSGWDPVTGLGSPNFERMRALFLSLP